MASQPLPRFLETQATRKDHAQKLERIARDTNSNVTKIRAQHTAADGRTLRGIPAIGRGVAGCIPGQNPEQITWR